MTNVTAVAFLIRVRNRRKLVRIPLPGAKGERKPAGAKGKGQLAKSLVDETGRTETRTLTLPGLGGQASLVPLAPVAVIVVGLVVALAVGFFGVWQLAQKSDEHAARRSTLIAATLSARLAQLPVAERLDVMRWAGRRTGAELVVVSRSGDVKLDATLGTTDKATLRRAVLERVGEATAHVGRTTFAAKPLGGDDGDYLVAFVRAPSAPEGGPPFVRALIALTTLLVGVAAAVAYSVSRDANRDVEFVAARVRGMADVRSEPAGEAVPVRTMDAVGALTAAFNALLERFAAAQTGYQDDLDRVRAADRERAAFLAAVSHELRSPLNAILGFADILMTEVDGRLSPETREEVEQIRGSGKHLLDLINDILELSALESGQLKLNFAPVDLAEVASEVVREAKGLALGRPLVVRCEIVSVPGTVLARADPRRIRQVLTNLVGNAVKFTQQGQVVVSVRNEGAMARVSVHDTGPGISAQERAVIFEEYQQSKEERMRRRGTGLGLAIARRLVVIHGGSIELESELGRGSTFKVRLPRWGLTAEAKR
jgi:signal transduction histidine kinase